MKWSKEAEEAVAGAPFFVRRKIRRRVEETAAERGAAVVLMEHVNTARNKYLHNQEDEILGCKVETCFGPGGCPNRALPGDELIADLEACARDSGMKEFLKSKVSGSLKFHHEFKICTADCPNACSRPQIADVGLIGALVPEADPTLCTGCGECARACKENAIRLSENDHLMVIDKDKCLGCGQCVRVCPSGAIKSTAEGYRIMLGGKLGRRPQLARELGRIFSRTEALALVKRCIEHHKAHNTEGERFGEIINRTGLDFAEPVTKTPEDTPESNCC
jgi:anaerobic sulfite reductase subunit C